MSNIQFPDKSGSTHLNITRTVHARFKHLSEMWGFTMKEVSDILTQGAMACKTAKEFADLVQGKENLERLDKVMSTQPNTCPWCQRGFEDCECVA